MPFSEPTPLTLDVIQADIDSSTPGVNTTSLANAIKRYADNLLLPGQENDTAPQSCGNNVTLSPRIMSGQVVTVCEAFVCTRTYAVPLDVTLIILLEMLGVKPSAPYSVTLTHA